jgi:hypothetical protein
MPVLQARIVTDRPGRYLRQFCKHAAAMGSGRMHRFRRHGDAPAGPGQVRVSAEYSDTAGTVVFAPWGRAELAAGDTGLLIRVDAADDDAAARIRTIIENNLRRFGRGQLAVDWQVDTGDSTPPTEADRC